MVIYCSVDNCFNKVSEGFSFFRCPKDPYRCEEWKTKLGFMGNHRYASLNSKECYGRIKICRIHFEEDCFSNQEKTRINALAVPTLCLNINTSANTTSTLKQTTENLVYSRDVSTQTQPTETREAPLGTSDVAIQTLFIGTKTKESQTGSQIFANTPRESRVRHMQNRELETEARTEQGRTITLDEVNKHLDENYPQEFVAAFKAQLEAAMALAAGKKWRETDTIKFVELYESAECLWNYRHPGYKNRNARDKAIQHIIQEMNLPEFGVNELKNKIKNIRSTYQQEVNKIRRSKGGFGGGFILEEYKTNLAWFPIADRFLSTCINSSKNPANISIDDDDSSMFQNNQPGLFSLVETEMSNELELEPKFSPSYVTMDHIKEEPIKVEYNSISPQYNKKRRLSQPQFLEGGDLKTEEFDFQPPAVENCQGDEWYHFGNNVACQLRNMPLERALVSQKRIMDILTEERIEAIQKEREEQKKKDSVD